MRRYFAFLLFVVCCSRASLAQTEIATLSGRVADASLGVVVGAEVEVTNTGTGVSSVTKTNDEGLFIFPSLEPGNYRLSIRAVGFHEVVETGIVLHVQDRVALNLTLQVGSVDERVVVSASDLQVNTEDASVSTVIDRNFVESLPLNGRSFNTLLGLTPGVVIAPSNGFSSPGQFSVAGQRTDSNNFSVDGVSANFGVAAGVGAGSSGTGTAQAFSALGGTSGLVSVDALQEFRIATSSFAPEFGRSPGGQVALTTRPGTNDFHGGVFDFFRNTVLDANNWFANASDSPRAPEHHNDFGGFLGGPIARDRIFFFFSYEGARLDLPYTEVQPVPSAYARSVAPSDLAPFLSAYPQPNDQAVNPGVYTAPFTGNFANTGTLNATSLRLDATLNDHYTVFGRFSYAPSETETLYSGANVQKVAADTLTFTAGANMMFNNVLANSLRGNYSTQTANDIGLMTSFGGAAPPNPSLYLGTLSAASNQYGFETFDTSAIFAGPAGKNETWQFELVDDLAATVGAHQLKFGGDYRDIFLDVDPYQHGLTYESPSVQALLSTGTVTLLSNTIHSARIRTQALSFYGQDTWKVTRRLTMTYGLRWEIDPAPAPRGATQLASWTNVDIPAQIALAPGGTPVWQTTYGNVAPRLGIAYQLNDRGDLVLRVGGGTFYDLGTGTASVLATYFPNSASGFYSGVTVPLSTVTPYLPTPSNEPPYSGAVYGFSPNLELPRSYQWNVALEKSFKDAQAISVSYVGQAGRDLLRREALYQPNANFASAFYLTTNSAFSNYSALQVQFRRRLTRGVQALLNYSFSHSLDNASDGVVAGPANTVVASNDYGSSSFDVRHSFSGAVSYALPAARKPGPLFAVTRDWSVDAVVVARTGFPFNAAYYAIGPAGAVLLRPDLVPGQPLWTSSAAAPGEKILNANAFSVPSTIQQGSEARNDIPGFGLTQVDVSLQRRFPFTDRVSLQFRTDAFNVFNHPNFTNPLGYFQYGPTELQSTETLNEGLGGLNPLFQQGGPRSLQVSLRLSF